MQYNRTRTMLGVVMGCCLLGILCSFAEAATVNKAFDMVTKIKSAEYGVVRQRVDGSIRIEIASTNRTVVRLAVDGVKREFDKEDVAASAIPIRAFVVQASIQRNAADVDLSMKIEEGGVSTNKIALSAQYRLAYLILDMLQIVVQGSTNVTAMGEGQVIQVAFCRPERVQVAGFGRIPLSDLLSCASPKVFLVAPSVRDCGEMGIDLYAVKGTGCRLELFSRSLGRDLSFAERAMNVTGAYKQPEDFGGNLASVLAAATNTDGFLEYEAHQIVLHDRSAAHGGGAVREEAGVKP